MKLIIDTDPGIDDALAILFAIHHPAIELLGLTCIFGNVSVDLARDNARRLLALAGQPLPVCAGAAAPLQIAPHPPADFVHHANGLGGVSLPLPDGAADPRDAADFIIEQVRAHPGEVVLAPIGPLTNLAIALQRAPDIAGGVKSVVAMGGAWREPGNVSPVAEANIWNDPHAAEAVFAADWPVTIVGLDATHQLLLDPGFFAQLAAEAQRQGGFLQDCHQFYLDFYASRHDGKRVCAGHDVLALLATVEAGLLDTEAAAISVVCEGPAIGQTLCAPPGRYDAADWDARPVHRVATGVDAPAARAAISQAIARAD